MPAKSNQLKLKIIQQYLEDTHENLIRSQAVVEQWLNATNLSIDELRFAPQNSPRYQQASMVVSHSVTEVIAKAKDAELLHTITMEEHQAIIFKLREVSKLNPGELPKNDLLYLEQQLSDIFGFEVVSELDDKRLPFAMGTMMAAPHLRRFPNDQLADHQRYQEAGLSKTRGSYDWMLEGGELSDQAAARERYGVALPLAYLPDWQQNYLALKQWYQYRKLLIINPFDLKAIVGSVTDGSMVATLKYQFAGSPEIIREGMIWSPSASGKILAFFINDEENKVVLGPINLAT